MIPKTEKTELSGQRNIPNYTYRENSRKETYKEEKARSRKFNSHNF